MGKDSLPPVGLADPERIAANRCGRKVGLLKLGRMRSLMVIDEAGEARFRRHAGATFDIPPNRQVLAAPDGTNKA